tara:strand:+ start:482 stop:1654 length:1173 start_codon:yes stop_codon:yes gene_type:complete
MQLNFKWVRLCALFLPLYICSGELFAQQHLDNQLPYRGHEDFVRKAVGLFDHSDSPVKINATIFNTSDFRVRENMGDDGFAKNQAAGHFQLNILNRFSILTELTSTRKHGSDHLSFEVERLIARLNYSDHFKLSLGRYHTPLGYWNSAFHHGGWLQTTVDRPIAMKFGSKIVPIHFVGGLLEGNIGSSNFSYRVGFGNARSNKINDVRNNFNSINDRAAAIVGASYRSTGRYRFEVGTGALFNKAVTAGGIHRVDEAIFNGYFVLLNEAPEVLIEYTHSLHDSDISNGHVNSVYGQLAYRLPFAGSKFKPYFRVEYIDVSRNNPLLGSSKLDYDGVLGGVRWDALQNVALKAEVRNEKYQGRERSTAFWFQVSLVLDVNRIIQRAKAMAK